MTTSTDPVTESLLFAAYERAAVDFELDVSLRSIGVSFTIEHSDAVLAPIRFGDSNGEPTIRIVFATAEFAQRFWSGTEPMAPALMDGMLTIHGPINRILELVDVLPLLFAALAK